ncbi:Uncharacterised protein [Vibrio cholerae]|nr:Uncharacterised protein [Vibrio cholerae]
MDQKSQYQDNQGGFHGNAQSTLQQSAWHHNANHHYRKKALSHLA